MKFDLFHDIQRTAKGFSICLDQLSKAKTLKDLNKHYEEDWVKSYQKVEITTIHNGKEKKLQSPDHNLTAAQKEAIRTTDNGSDIFVFVEYIPVGEFGESRENNFSFKVDPTEATFPGGVEKMHEFLSNVVEKVSSDAFKIYQVTAINFSIDESGAIVSAHIDEASQDDGGADDYLLEAICNMPRWQPAKFADGELTKQDFVFTVGDISSCTMNILDIVDRTP